MKIRETAILMVLSSWEPPLDMPYAVRFFARPDGAVEFKAFLWYAGGVMEVEIEADAALDTIHPRMTRYAGDLIEKMRERNNMKGSAVEGSLNIYPGRN